MILINGRFVDLVFEERVIQEESNQEKNNDIVILSKHIQRVYAKNIAQIEVKIFDKQQNKLNDFYQNYVYVPDTNIETIVVNKKNQEFFSSAGTTNNLGFFETEFLIPDNSKRETLTVTINAENKQSESSKVLQIFVLGTIPDKD